MPGLIKNFGLEGHSTFKINAARRPKNLQAQAGTDDSVDSLSDKKAKHTGANERFFVGHGVRAN
jgi:hypothetical protein